jgi:hypothetical protein
MTSTVTFLLVSVLITLLLILGGLAARTIARRRQRSEAHIGARRRHSGAMLLRFRRTRPGGHDWEPLRISVRELKWYGLRRWPDAPGVYFPHDDSLHCRGCVTDPRTRASIVRRHADHDQMLVLFGGSDEGALVHDNCATHGRSAA